MLMRAVHPGEILKEELEALGVSHAEFARQINVPPNRISQIIAGKRSVTGDTALRLERDSGRPGAEEALIPSEVWEDSEARHSYEHIIRNDEEWDRVREYIVNNPMSWETDSENPNASI